MGRRSEHGQVTGTKDPIYNLLWFTENCLHNVLRLETYIEDARGHGDVELEKFLTKAQADSRKGAEEGKRLLRERMTAGR